jgi:diaminopimelate epimerase
MPTEIPFWKMHGAGNDFVLVDDRGEAFPATDIDWMASLGDRRTGVGCDGFMLIQGSTKADFRMRFFNPDGNEAEMCGNGARCVARLASEIGAASAQMSIETVAGVLTAEIVGELVRLQMTEPTDWRMDRDLALPGGDIRYSFVNSGVPHAVIQSDDLAGHDVRGMGNAVRYHNDFAPAGTNANFIGITGEQSLTIRTYERGVEDETLACGTGIVASALVAAKLGKVSSPVSVTCAHGDVLEVAFDLTENGAENVMLLGPAEHVFRGTLVYG